MEKKIGEIFECKGEWYQCVKGDMYDYCKACPSFENLRCTTLYGNKDCWLKSTCKQLEKIGEPYMLEDKKFQKYKVFKTPYIYHKIDCSWQSFSDPYYISLEIKEDMEEKKQCGDTRFRIIARAKEHLFQATNIAEDKKELEVLDSFLLRCWQMGWLKQYEDGEEKKLKPFDLEAAKSGKPVCTRDGRKARIICFDQKDIAPIVGLVTGLDGKESIYAFYKDGRVSSQEERVDDLMMLPEKKEGWVNVYKERIYSTKEEAIEATYDSVTYVDTVKVCWEE